ncbi:MAG TPA: protein-L-isoaspartate(D-aspartate) O-methyltransferase [Solirubrobacteraceae bacterium]|nr:protein-L-isoaspartate(D-aspartate) O-methyltransferase [Solirubrobacteraceae bacterium]
MSAGGPGPALAAELAPHVRDERVLAAIAAVPRDRFVPAAEQRRAWANEALGIGEGQTISQPLVVARMCELLALRGDERVLDVGTGSGYHAAVLARLCAHVFSVEVHATLSAGAAEALREAGIANVTLAVGDGSAGLTEHAPFDAVNVAAAGPRKRLDRLVEQLADGGRLVAPVEARWGEQRLVTLHRRGDEIERREHERVRFVPLVGGQ